MDRFKELQRAYEAITRNFAVPFNYEEFQQFRGRRKVIFEDARKLIGNLGIPEARWLAAS
jgi:hypothetical protein